MTRVAAGARRVRIAPGVALHTLEWHGSPVALPFLLVHGLASNARTWERVGALLAGEGHRVAAVDLRGHGRSDDPGRGYDFPTLCDDLLAVLDALGYERAVVVGQSTGGNVAVELARRAGPRLAGVAGVDGGALELHRLWPRWEDCADAMAPPVLDGRTGDEVEGWLRAGHPSWDDAGLEASMANYEVAADGTVRPRLRREHHMRILRALWEHRPSSFFAELTTPVLLLLADTGDDWTEAKRAEAAGARELLRRSRVRWFSPADHDLHVERPGQVAAELRRAAEDGFFER